MKHLILHIGAHKTGSSAIQNAFFRNRELLAGAGLHYLGAKMNHSGMLLAAFDRRPGDFVTFPRQAESAEAMTAVRQIFADFIGGQPEGAFVISGEEGETFDAAAVEAAIGFFRPLVDRLTVVWFVRPLRSAASSALQQRVKAGAWRPKMPNGIVPHYIGGVRAFADHPGVDRTQVLIYAREELHRGCAIATMLRICGQPDELYDRLDLPQEVNVSLSLPGVALLAAAHGVVPAPSAAWRLLARLATRLEGPKFKVPDEVLDHLLCRPKVRDKLAWVSEAAGRPLEDFEAPLPTEPSAGAPTPIEWFAGIRLSEQDAARALRLIRASQARQAAIGLWGTDRFWTRETRAARLECGLNAAV